MTIWKNIPNYDGIYSVSRTGLIKRLKGFRCKKDRILIQNKHKEYLMVTLCKDGIQNRMLVHRIVATVFIPNPSNKPFVNHKRPNSTTNNSVDNLEWCTQKENIQHSIKLGNKTCENSSRATLKNIQVKAIKKLWSKGGITQTDIAKRYNVNRTIIQSIVTNKTWKEL